MRGCTMLKQVYALPRAQRHSPPFHRNRKMRRRQGGANMRGHVVRPFDGVPVQPVILGNHARLKNTAQIVDHIRVRILLASEATRDVCCTKTVSSPVPASRSASQSEICPVNSYRPLPRVEICNR